MSGLIMQRLVEFARSEFRLDWNGFQGAPYLSRVRQSGLLIADHTAANARVAENFAFIYDLGRENDHYDPEHGNRAEIIAENMAGNLIDVSTLELQHLVKWRGVN